MRHSRRRSHSHTAAATTTAFLIPQFSSGLKTQPAMRLFNMNLVVLAAVLLASGTAVSNADQTSVLNVDVVHSSRVLSGEDKSFLRRHPTDHGKEERGGGDNMFAALKLQKM
ncbi:Avirulence protein (Avh) [Phytophthora palmivora]|uniref:RxLR effector protein n=1 Tax=Phytophthora palmivora TaxID=4796 RepID=A0A2P4WX88_9STRA|nr:Avirulence protein (Avh) [Phytophthora palmivora]